METVYTLRRYGRGLGGRADAAASSVTVAPADHLEWQPPHMIAVRVSWSPFLTAKMREPESSIGAKLGAADAAAVLVLGLACASGKW